MMRESNPRPFECEPNTLPSELITHERTLGVPLANVLEKNYECSKNKPLQN